MPRVVRETLISLRELTLAWGPFVLIALAALTLAYALLDPQPPKRVVLATGPEGSAYAVFGKRYAQELKRFGIEVTLRQTNGSRENLRMLHDTKKREADIGFVQGGSSDAARALDEKDGESPLVSLGSLFYEPYWLFYRTEAAKKLGRDGITRLAQLRGWRVNVGTRGSGAPGLTTRLLAANQVDREELTRSNLADTPAVQALLAGEIDAMVMVTAPEGQLVQMLLQTPGVKLFQFQQAEAYSRRYTFINRVTLPKGVADLARDVPIDDIPLIAASTSLVAREGTHPSLIQLFVQAAARIHSAPGWIAQAGQFPSAEKTEFPLAKEAERFYKNGPPILQRYLPFWLANLIDRMWVAMISIIAILIPLSRLIPPLYEFRVRSRIFRWYRQLRDIEDRNEAGKASPELLAELDRLDQQATRISVPLSYTDELYSLRQHIDLVRARLDNSGSEPDLADPKIGPTGR